MTQRSNHCFDNDLAIVFETVLRSSQEPPMDDLTEQAVTGGRRALRRRRTALAAAFGATCAAVTAVVVLLAGVDSETQRPDRPTVPAKSPSPTQSSSPPVQAPRVPGVAY